MIVERKLMEEEIEAELNRQKTNLYGKMKRDYIACDICGIKEVNTDQWYGDYYDISGTKIKMEEGQSWPEGGNRTTIEYHICTKCFKEKLIPFMRSLGATETVKESDW